LRGKVWLGLSGTAQLQHSLDRSRVGRMIWNRLDMSWFTWQKADCPDR